MFATLALTPTWYCVAIAVTGWNTPAAFHLSLPSYRSWLAHLS